MRGEQSALQDRIESLVGEASAREEINRQLSMQINDSLSAAVACATMRATHADARQRLAFLAAALANTTSDVANLPELSECVSLIESAVTNVMARERSVRSTVRMMEEGIDLHDR